MRQAKRIRRNALKKIEILFKQNFPDDISLPLPLPIEQSIIMQDNESGPDVVPPDKEAFYRNFHSTWRFNTGD